MFRQILETSIKVFRSLKEEEELVLQIQKLNRLRNLMVSLRMCSTENELSEVPFLSRSDPFMDDIVISNEGVTKFLKGLNPSKALGHNELHPRVL